MFTIVSENSEGREIYQIDQSILNKYYRIKNFIEKNDTKCFKIKNYSHLAVKEVLEKLEFPDRKISKEAEKLYYYLIVYHPTYHLDSNNDLFISIPYGPLKEILDNENWDDKINPTYEKFRAELLSNTWKDSAEVYFTNLLWGLPNILLLKDRGRGFTKRFTYGMGSLKSYLIKEKNNIFTRGGFYDAFLNKEYVPKMFNKSSKLDFSDNKIYIGKKTFSWHSQGIKMIPDQKTFEEFLNEKENIYPIFQEYIKNPYLINETKFHIRCYFTVYVNEFGYKSFYHKDFKLNLASVKYDLSDFSNFDSHVTAASESKTLERAVWPKDTGLSADKIKNIYQQVENILADISKIAIKQLSYDDKECNAAFEVYGVDLLLDDQLKLWLLEINEKTGYSVYGLRETWKEFSTNYNEKYFKWINDMIIKPTFGLDKFKNDLMNNSNQNILPLYLATGKQLDQLIKIGSKEEIYSNIGMKHPWDKKYIDELYFASKDDLKEEFTKQLYDRYYHYLLLDGENTIGYFSFRPSHEEYPGLQIRFFKDPKSKVRISSLISFAVKSLNYRFKEEFNEKLNIYAFVSPNNTKSIKMMKHINFTKKMKKFKLHDEELLVYKY